MARDAVSVTDLTVNGAVAMVAGVDINPTNGATIDADGDTQRLIIWIQNTYAGTKAATIKAGNNPPAFASGQGDLSVSLTQNQEKFVVIESARFAQADGSIYVDFDTGMTGKIAAYRLPKV